MLVNNIRKIRTNKFICILVLIDFLYFLIDLDSDI